MPLQVYNTMARRKEPFEPLEPGHVRMYACGITAYDYCHLGHARGSVVFDIIRRHLEHLGYRVTYVRNFTDIDDKIIRRAQEQGVEPCELAERFIEEYNRDMDALGVRRADIEPRATDYVPQMVRFIQRLEQKGFAYRAAEDVFFDVASFLRYGALSHRDTELLEAGARVEVNPHKRNPLDFALWKAAKAGEPWWESPWGPGRPGWHIECSTMSMELLGEQFDIHAGGEDLVFPHHENEIAQSEARTEKPWVRYWLHNGFVTINREKMSKSTGNFFLIRALLERFPAEVVRFFLLTTHYRSPVDYAEDLMREAWRALDRLYNVRLRLAELPQGEETGGAPQRAGALGTPGGAAGRIAEAVAAVRAEFREAMDDDFNSAKAIGHLFDYGRRLNAILDELPPGEPLPRKAEAEGVFQEVGEVLGLFGVPPLEWFQKERPGGEGERVEEATIERLVRERQEARKRKDWRRADGIREELSRMGVLLEDRPEGTVWKWRT